MKLETLRLGSFRRNFRYFEMEIAFRGRKRKEEARMEKQDETRKAFCVGSRVEPVPVQKGSFYWL